MCARQEGEDLARGFEDIAHDLSDEPGQEEFHLLTDSIESITYSLCAFCQGKG